MMQLRLFTVHEMAPLTPRQEKAAALTRWLQDDLGVFVTSPLPLGPTQRLRFDVLHQDREAVLAKLREQDWSPIACDVGQRFHNGMLLPRQTFELDLPLDPPPVQNRTIYGEVASSKKSDHEIEQVKRYLGLTGPKK